MDLQQLLRLPLSILILGGVMIVNNEAEYTENAIAHLAQFSTSPRNNSLSRSCSALLPGTARLWNCWWNWARIPTFGPFLVLPAAPPIKHLWLVGDSTHR